jgi:DNA-directed RNA polymerase specialized sigma24 family protein
MMVGRSTFYGDAYDTDNNAIWKEIVCWLRPLVQYMVYSTHMEYWYGQEADIIEDIVQETVRRLVERLNQAERGEAAPVQSLKGMAVVIARNYCKDMRRRDSRLQRTTCSASPLEICVNEQLNPFEITVEYIFQEELFKWLVHEIAGFPKKQRQALLVDLANRMYFGQPETFLQMAFRAEGIEIQIYRHLLPKTPRELARHRALVTIAYKRVASLAQMQRYFSML